MGLFSSSSSSTSNADPSHPPPSQDGGFIAPDRSTREACYGGRDSFFRCLDANGIVDSVREDEKAKAVCGNELKEFEKVCAASWVTYFKKRRVMEHKRDLTLKQLNAEGATPIEGSGGAQAAALRGK